MDIINNIEWYFGEPKSAKHKDTRKKITKKELSAIVFDNSIEEGNVKFCLPLSNDLDFCETRELPRPLSVEQILIFLRDFYREPLKKEHFDRAFEDNEEWKEEIIERFDGDVSRLTNYHVFEDTCTPDFCGILLITESGGENAGEYFVQIGPE
jgi:hypothetical protein